MSPMSTIRSVCVYCGSSPGADPAFLAAATAFGKVLAREGVELVYGGGSNGLMGALASVSAAIATARLDAATNALGTLDELYVIASAVIGGTSLAGGVGTVVGAMIGALVMQSLQSGMTLIGLDTPLQSVVVGIVLVFAVWLDTLYRRRAK